MDLQVDFLILDRLFTFLLFRRDCFFMVRLCGWYSEHYRAFELTACPSKDTDLIELSDLADDYPLTDYFVGSHKMVTLKRHIHV